MKKEFFLHGVFLLSIAMLVAFPQIRRIWVTPARSFYPIIHKIPEDYYSYLSYIRQGKERLFPVDKYSATQSTSRSAFVYYGLLGRIAALLGLSPIFMYWVGLVVPLLMYYVFTYQLVKFVLPTARWLTMYVIFFGSPFAKGDIHLAGQTISLGIEEWMGLDIYSRLTMKPHHFIATALFVGATYCFIRFQKEKKLIQLIVAGIFLNTSILFFAIPGFLLLLALLTILAGSFFPVIRLWIAHKSLPALVVKKHHGHVFLVSVMIFAVAFLSLSFVRAEVEKFQLISYESQFNDPQTSLFSLAARFFLPYGILPFFALAGLFSLRKQWTFSQALVCCMIGIPAVLFILASKGYVPLPAIRFVYFAPYVFMGILSSWGMTSLVGRIRNRRTAMIAWGTIGVILLSMTWCGLRSYWFPEYLKTEIYYNTYIPQPYMRAMEYLDTYTSEDSAVMSTFGTGMFIPAFTHNRVYTGHEAIANFGEIYWYAESFMEGKLPKEDAGKLLGENNISYVFWDTGVLPTHYQGLMEPVFTHEYITIYKTL